MSAWPEMMVNRPIRGEKLLRVSRGLEPLHAPFPLTASAAHRKYRASLARGK
jgi:hypothetical protein